MFPNVAPPNRLSTAGVAGGEAGMVGEGRSPRLGKTEYFSAQFANNPKLSSVLEIKCWKIGCLNHAFTNSLYIGQASLQQEEIWGPSGWTRVLVFFLELPNWSLPSNRNNFSFLWTYVKNSNIWYYRQSWCPSRFEYVRQYLHCHLSLHGCYFPAVLKSPEMMVMKMFLVIKLIPNITVMSTEQGKPLFEMCCFQMGIAC